MQKKKMTWANKLSAIEATQQKEESTQEMTQNSVLDMGYDNSACGRSIYASKLGMEKGLKGHTFGGDSSQ